MEFSLFQVERVDYAVLVTMNRPKKHNAMGRTFWAELREIFQSLSKDPEVRAVVLCGSGKQFCAGLDLGDNLAPLLRKGGGAGLDFGLAQAFLREIQDSFRAVEQCPTPVIAAVHGACMGAGLDLIAACDLRLAAKNARFSLRESKVGMVIDLAAIARLAPIIGEGHARELAFTAKEIDARRAGEIGLISDILPDRKECINAAMEIARQIAQNSPLSVQLGKQAANHQREQAPLPAAELIAQKNAQLLCCADVIHAFLSEQPRRQSNRKSHEPSD